ncbi:MAG: regulator, partial [Anaerolineae bacterium]|nr:regulator [Anaerolineae bacterium]
MNTKLVAASVVVVALIAGIYTMSGDEQAAPRQAAPVPTADMQAAKLQPGAELPANHPAFDPSAQIAQGEVIAQAATGKTVEDKTAKFSHFQVGNRNVKTIYPDGNVVWVGTSGGVIRYDTSNDDYRLFDVKSGLLSQGVFSVDKLEGRIALGTYGGGLSLYDKAKDKWENFNVPDGLGDAFVYKTLKASNGD